VSKLKRIGTIKKEKYMEMNKSVGTVDYISAPKPGKDQWFMPVVLNQSGTKIKFYCKFDPQVAVGDQVLVHYGQERNGNATAFKVERPDKDINESETSSSVSSTTTTSNRSSALPEDMIAVGLAGRITEVLMTLHHEKGIQLKDPAGEVAKWIKIGVEGYKQNKTSSSIEDIKDAFPGTKVENVDDDVDDEVPF
jgi:hypothetical protein